MKSTYLPFFAGVTVLFLIFGCTTSPSQKETVWTLLAAGKTAEAMELFKGEATVRERDEQGRTALHVAAETNNTEMVRFLLALGAEVDAEDNAGRTPLAITAESQFSEPGRLLAAAGADLFHPVSTARETIAARAIFGGQNYLAAILGPYNVNSSGRDGKTILHLTAIEGASGQIDTILTAGADINRTDGTGKTALDYALSRTDSIRYARVSEKLILAGGKSDNPFFAYFAPPVRSSNYNIRLADGYTVFHYAAMEGYKGYIDFLIEKKADPNIKNNSGATPLHEAARAGQIAAMEQLISAGAEVNAQDAKGNSPMHLAIPPNRHREAILLLLSRGANPNLRDEHGEIPLQVAVTLDRSIEVVQSLLEGGSSVTNRNIDGKTALYLAVEEDRIEMVPLLLAWRSSIFAADNAGLTPLEKALRENRPSLDLLLTEETVLSSDTAGNTPLHIAVRNNARVTIDETILNRGGAVDARNKEGNTPLHIAVQLNDEAAGTLFVNRGADIFAPNARGESPLYMAFHTPPLLREWMLTKKTLEARDGLGNTALHYAAQWKLDRYVPLLVSKGSNLEAANATGETPVFWAARADSPATITALLQAGANLGARDALGNTSLHGAVRWNAPLSVDTLTAAGLSVNSQNLNGKAPLHEAVRLGLTSMEDKLISKGANVEIRDTDGNTPLMEAIMAGFPGAAERLTNAGADPITRNNKGDTPLHIAVLLQRYDLVTLLLTNGATIHARNSAQITPFKEALGISPVMVSTLLTKDRITMADDDGLSPLHIALNERAPVSMLQTIIRQGGRTTTVDKQGRTPLRLAVDLGSLDSAKLLADSGADVFSTAMDGKTPAEAAMSEGEGAVRALFSGKSVAEKDGAGNTVLHYAAKSANATVISLLMQLGADKRIKNIAGELPVDIALRWNRGEAAGLLQLSSN